MEFLHDHKTDIYMAALMHVYIMYTYIMYTYIQVSWVDVIKQPLYIPVHIYTSLVG